jgi:hypothetical protein
MNINALAPMSYQNVVQQVVDNINSFSPDCLQQKNELIALVKNPANASAVMYAYKSVGIPPANRPKKKRWPRKDIVYCDNYVPLQFLYALKYRAKYPDIANDQKSCGTLESLLMSLEVEKVNVDKDRLTDKLVADIKMPIVQELNSKYLSQFSQLDCKNYQEDVESKEFEQKITEREEKANKPTTTTYFIYGISGAIVLITLTLLLRKK